MRLALYAHFSSNQGVAGHVFYHLQELKRLGFRVCFISNSPLSKGSESELAALCERVIQRENVGFDFCMWQRGLAEYDLSKVDELLITNSSIIGPVRSLAPLWTRPELEQCDFWGLTDNTEISHHLQSYFLVFRRPVIQSDCFSRFWASVLPYRDKSQVIRSYEIGLTCWLEQNGFKWASVFPEQAIWRRHFEERTLLTKVKDRIRNRRPPGLNTTVRQPRILIEAGMPFLKAVLLKPGNDLLQPEVAYSLLRTSALPKEALEELLPRSSVSIPAEDPER
jgi:lipopolysaccharide biosynthesis protein